MIFVFKTSIQTKKQVKRLTPYLNYALPHAKWNFDLDDVDNILRIDSEEDCVETIIELLKTHQYYCEELE